MMARPTMNGLEMHLASIHKQVEAFQPHLVVVDPISNFVSAGTAPEARSMMTRLVDYLKSRQITALLTNLNHAGSVLEQTELDISSLIDTWLLLRDIELNGERNRGLYILKSRGMAHSNQIREFLLTDRGRPAHRGLLGAGRRSHGFGKAGPGSEGEGDGGAAQSGDRKEAGRTGTQAASAGGSNRRSTVAISNRQGRNGTGHHLRAGVFGETGTGPSRNGPEPQGRFKRTSSIPEERSQMIRQPKSNGQGVQTEEPKQWQLRLYVAGQTPKSVTAFANLKRHLRGTPGGRVRDRGDRPHREPSTGKGRPDRCHSDPGAETARSRSARSSVTCRTRNERWSACNSVRP